MPSVPNVLTTDNRLQLKAFAGNAEIPTPKGGLKASKHANVWVPMNSVFVDPQVNKSKPLIVGPQDNKEIAQKRQSVTNCDVEVDLKDNEMLPHKSHQSIQSQICKSSSAALSPIELGEAGLSNEEWPAFRQALRKAYPEYWPRGLSAMRRRDDGEIEADYQDAHLAAQTVAAELLDAGVTRILISSTGKAIELQRAD